MLKKVFSLVIFLMLVFQANSQITDAQNLTKDVEALKYSDPVKALKTAQYIVSNQSFGSVDDVYNSYLLQAEIYINLEKYNDAVVKLISADRLYSNVSNDFLKAKNDFLLGKIYVKTGFQNAISYSISELEKTSESLNGEEKNTVVIWKTELEN